MVSRSRLSEMRTRNLLFPLLAACLLLAACSGEAADASPTLSPVQARGRSVYSLHCASCHSTSPQTVIVGPSLAGIAIQAGQRVSGESAEQYLRTSILQPEAYLVSGFEPLMPADLSKRLTGEDFDALVAYLLTLE